MERVRPPHDARQAGCGRLSPAGRQRPCPETGASPVPANGTSSIPAGNHHDRHAESMSCGMARPKYASPGHSPRPRGGRRRNQTRRGAWRGRRPSPPGVRGGGGRGADRHADLPVARVWPAPAGPFIPISCGSAGPGRGPLPPDPGDPAQWIRAGLPHAAGGGAGRARYPSGSRRPEAGTAPGTIWARYRRCGRTRYARPRMYSARLRPRAAGHVTGGISERFGAAFSAPACRRGRRHTWWRPVCRCGLPDLGAGRRRPEPPRRLVSCCGAAARGRGIAGACRGIPRDMRKVPAPYGMARGAIPQCHRICRPPSVCGVRAMCGRGAYAAHRHCSSGAPVLIAHPPSDTSGGRIIGNVRDLGGVPYFWPAPNHIPDWNGRDPLAAGRGSLLDRPMRIICAAFCGSMLCGARAPDRARRHAHCIGRPWHVWPPHSAGGCAMPHARPATPLWGSLRLCMWRRGGSPALPQASPARRMCGPMPALSKIQRTEQNQSRLEAVWLGKNASVGSRSGLDLGRRPFPAASNGSWRPFLGRSRTPVRSTYHTRGPSPPPRPGLHAKVMLSY